MTKNKTTNIACEEFGSKYKSDRNIYNRLIDGYYRSISEILEKLPLNNISTALEIGCGEGFSTERLIKILPSNIKLEASEKMEWQIPLAKQRLPKLRIINEDIYSLQRSDNSLDIIFCLEVLEHLADVPRALKEIFRTTNKYAIIGVPNEPLWRILNVLRGKYWRWLGNTPGHINHWSSDNIVEILHQYNFRILKLLKPLPWMIILVEKNGRKEITE